MIQDTNAFHFEYVPFKIDKSSIKVFQNAKDEFSLEYAIFNPKAVFINMYQFLISYILCHLRLST